MSFVQSAIFNLKERSDLNDKLKESAKKTLTKEEIKAQRISYVYGNLPKDSPLSKKDVTKMVNKYDGQ